MYIVLAKAAFAEDQVCFPSLSTISSLAGINRNYATKAVKSLEAFNLIEVHRESSEVNLYSLTSVQEWRSLSGGGRLNTTSDNFEVGVSNSSYAQYQSSTSDSVQIDTRNQLSKSTKEITISDVEKSLLERCGNNYPKEVILRAISLAKVNHTDSKELIKRPDQMELYINMAIRTAKR